MIDGVPNPGAVGAEFKVLASKALLCGCLRKSEEVSRFSMNSPQLEVDQFVALAYFSKC